MQVEKVKRFMLEAFTKATANRDQQFVPLLHALPGSAPVKENVCNEEFDARRAFEEAYVEGEKAGFEMGMKKVEPLVERLNTYLAEIETYERDLIQKAEELAFGLALTFTENILLKECTEHQDALLRMIRKALELCEQKGKKVIRIRPEDSKFIEQQNTSWTIVPDDTIKEPGFIIETDFGDVDGRLSVQLEELRREFLTPIQDANSSKTTEDEA